MSSFFCKNIKRIKNFQNFFAYLVSKVYNLRMEIENANILGVGLISLTALLGTYYLILKIRELHSIVPNPKFAYVTYSQMERVREEMLKSVADAIRDLRALRSEIREETRSLQKHYMRSLEESRELISHNAENISSLIAQMSICHQRLSELSVKTDRILVKDREVR